MPEDVPGPIKDPVLDVPGLRMFQDQGSYQDPVMSEDVPGPIKDPVMLDARTYQGSSAD